jgi:hypothetical protein
MGTVFDSMNDLLRHLSIPTYDELKYSKVGNSSMLIPTDKIYKYGEKIFEKGNKNTYNFKPQYYKSSQPGGGVKQLEHYNLKKFFYETADLNYVAGLPSLSQYGRPKGVSLSFKVRLDNSNIGGSLTYEDLGIDSENKIKEFLEFVNVEYSEISTVKIGGPMSKYRPPTRSMVSGESSYTKAVYDIISKKMYDKYAKAIMSALAREIVEESTPNGNIAESVDNIVSKLSFIKVNRENIDESTKSASVEFKFSISGNNKIIQQRELDTFPVLFNNKRTDIYYIYRDNTGSRGRFTDVLPYSIAKPINIIEPVLKPVTEPTIEKMVSIPLVTFELLLERIGEKKLSDKCKAFIKQQDIIERSKKLVPISLRQLNLLENAAKKEPEKVLPLIQEIKLNSSNFKTNEINSFKKLNYNNQSDIDSFKKLNIPTNTNINTNDGVYNNEVYNNTIINDFKPLQKDIELKPMSYKMDIVNENEDFILNFKNLRKQRNVLNNRKNKTINKNKNNNSKSKGKTENINKKSIAKKNSTRKNSTRKNISKRIRNIMKMTNYTNNDSNMLNI